jgi:hypothetical protein
MTGLSVSTDSLSFEANESVSETVTVTAYTAWEVSANVEWLIFSPSSGSGNGYFTVAATANEGAEREAVIRITSGNESAEIEVVQSVSPDLHYEIDGIDYLLRDTVAWVTNRPDGYSGKIVIPDTVSYSGKRYDVTRIEAEAFANSGLTAVTLPSSLTSVGARAFSGCSSLDTVEVAWDTPAYPEGISTAFDGVNLSTCTLIVPPGSEALYQAAWFWSYFGKIDTPTSINDKPSEDVTVRIEGGKLHINTPTAETIHIYSFTGKLLYTATKEAGTTTFTLPHLPENLCIVKGSSGWSIKIFQTK